MSIAQQLRSELKDAMRARDQQRLDVIRAVETEVKMARSAPGFSGEVDDALYERLIAAYVKKMKKALAEYEGLGERGAEMADKLRFEVDYLSRWLPKQLGEDEVRELVRKAIEELGAASPKQAGRIVGHLMKQHGKELDGKLVHKIATEELGGSTQLPAER